MKLRPEFRELPDEFFVRVRSDQKVERRNLFLAITVTAVASYGTIFRNWPMVIGLVPAAILIIWVLMYLSNRTVANTEAASARIVPYFQSAVPGPDTFERGHALASEWKYLDAAAHLSDLTPLSSFRADDDVKEDSPLWVDATVGLEAVNALFRHVKSDPSKSEAPSELVLDFEYLQQRLLEAERLNVKFCLHLVSHWAKTLQHSFRAGHY